MEHVTYCLISECNVNFVIWMIHEREFSNLSRYLYKVALAHYRMLTIKCCWRIRLYDVRLHCLDTNCCLIDLVHLWCELVEVDMSCCWMIAGTANFLLDFVIVDLAEELVENFYWTILFSQRLYAQTWGILGTSMYTCFHCCDLYLCFFLLDCLCPNFVLIEIDLLSEEILFVPYLLLV